MNRRAAGFTLVELLVVIALIALLMTLLMPALSAARRQSEQSICLSRLRQLTAACTAYAVDHNGEFPFGKRVNWADHDHYRSWLNGYMWKVLRNRYGLPRECGTCVHANALPEDVGAYDPSIREYADVAWGWIYWGNRQDILPWGGSRGYRTAKGIGRPGTSPTLLTCIVEDSSEAWWGSVATCEEHRHRSLLPRLCAVQPQAGEDWRRVCGRIGGVRAV